MRIGIAGPFDLNIIKEVFNESERLAIDKIKGLGGSQPAQYALSLMKGGHELFLYTTSISVPKGEERLFSSSRVTLKIGHRPGPFVRMVTFQFGEIRSITGMISADKPDVIHAQWSYEFAAAAINSGLPHIITVRDWAPKILFHTRHPYRLIRLFLSFLVFSKGDYFVANSPYIHRKLVFLKRRLFPFIPNGISDHFLLQAEKVFNNEKLVIVAINNGADGGKNVRKLIEGFSLLSADHTDIYLKLVGSGQEPYSKLWRWASDNKLLDNVEFLGPIKFDSVLNELDKSDLMVHPSLEESFGNIIVEAMCRGVPVIAGRESGAVPWVVADAGLLVDVSSAKSIAEAIRLFYQNRDLLNRYSKAGFENVKSRFTLSAITESYTCYYSKIISGSVD
jgi:glycosyltransferase involved in cell wall biosynthesis